MSAPIDLTGQTFGAKLYHYVERANEGQKMSA
jgi:hypothetical protein